MRKNLLRYKEGLLKHVDPTNEKAMQKVRHYNEALDEQLRICDNTDEFIDALVKPLPLRTLGDLLKPVRKDTPKDRFSGDGPSPPEKNDS